MARLHTSLWPTPPTPTGRLGLTQAALAERLGSSQSRVAKMEAAHRSVSTDLPLRALFRLGAGAADIARLLTTKVRVHTAWRPRLACAC